MGKQSASLGPVVVGGLALAVVLLLLEQDSAETDGPRKPADGPPPPPPPPSPSPGPKPVPTGGDDSTDDETALARMLQSEDARSGAIQIVIGWITLQRARRAKKSIYQYVTSGFGYGPQVRGDIVLHAATTEKPTAQSREVARSIIRGKISPSAKIRSHAPGAWAERKTKKTVTDDWLIQLQDIWNEGIYGQIQGTNWILFSPDAPRIKVAPYRDATARLDAVPRIPAVDLTA